MKNEQKIIWKAKDDQHILKGVHGPAPLAPAIVA